MAAADQGRCFQVEELKAEIEGLKEELMEAEMRVLPPSRCGSRFAKHN